MHSHHAAETSVITATIVGLLYPFILLLGFYVIVNGHYTPGGGFQGGSVLASVFVARYAAFPVDDTDVRLRHAVQRLFLTLIVVVPVLVLFSGVLHRVPQFHAAYLTAMDIFIGVQVGFGLGVAVLRFAFFEGVGKTWHL